jgi:hypothetical protein
MDLEEFDNFLCPYCGQSNQLLLDTTAGNTQKFVVDCEVCCAPIVLRIRLRGRDSWEIDAQKENE